MWVKLHRLILDELGSRGELDWSRCAIDSVSVRAFTDGAGDAELAHEAFDGAAGHRPALAVQVPPDFPRAVDAVVGVVCLLDQDLQFGVADDAGRGDVRCLWWA